MIIRKLLLVTSINLFFSTANCEESIGVPNSLFRNGITSGERSHSRLKRNINSDLLTMKLQELFDEMNDIKIQNAKLHANYATTFENIGLALSSKIDDIGNKVNEIAANQEAIMQNINSKHDELTEKQNPSQIVIENEKNTISSATVGDYENVPMDILTHVPPSNISNFIDWQDSVIRNVNSYKINSMATLSNFLQRDFDNAKRKTIKQCEGENLIEGVFNSCFTLHKHFSGLKNGLYRTFPSKTSAAKTVYCDMETNGGGWTAFQRRGYGLSKSFHRNWNEYANGFGNPAIEDYWLGLEAIHDLTKSCNNEIMMTGTLKNATLLYLTFSTFNVADNSQFYKLTLNDYQPSLSNFSTPNDYYHSGEIFSTFDKDNDKHSTNCANAYKSGWWHNNCYVINPNSVINGHLGIQFVSVGGTFVHVDKTEFKIRPLC